VQEIYQFYISRQYTYIVYIPFSVPNMTTLYHNLHFKMSNVRGIFSQYKTF